MALIVKAIRGTQDILPKDSYKWRFVENILLDEAELYGFKEIRTPVFEHTELFLRSVGENTDVVNKEMYTFNDKGGRSISLRPEGTAGAIRSILEHGINNEGLPVRTSYITSCYRYEKPQTGRLREFHQFGVEVLGALAPSADAELISLASSLFERLGIENISIQINSIGCAKCRENYYKELKKYLAEHKEELCGNCIERMERAPMRVLDCKSPNCSKIACGAPLIVDFLCEECSSHFEGVKQCLDVIGISYKVNPKIVRGLDYYTKTVFEFISEDLGSQSALGGGGRYDGLVKELGGPDTPSLGFGMGMERIFLLLEKQNVQIPLPKKCDMYIASIGDAGKLKAFELAVLLRKSGFIVECDVLNKSIKAQMKYANKIGSKFCIVVGEDEVNSNKAKIKNMYSSDEVEISLGENFISEFYKIHIEDEHKSIGLV